MTRLILALAALTACLLLTACDNSNPTPPGHSDAPRQRPATPQKPPDEGVGQEVKSPTAGGNNVPSRGTRSGG